jgi:sterol desaturase/sphingolipid hydroxylase (fatty acid hydroxylase superfamily)
MLPTLTGLAVGFVVLLVLFRGIELLRPVSRRLPVLRRGFWTDLAYWIFTPLVTRAATRLSVIIVLIPIAYAIYGRVDKDLIDHGFGPASRLPLWLQATAILVLSDFIGYWMHRWFHGGRMWRFHAIHHSSIDLDWLSSVRLHPVNDALMRIATTIPVLALGFAPVSAASIVPVLIFMSIVVHANVDWDWGPLRSVLASPRFHRWHHTDETAARDKNFAGIFPVWDILFGTYYLPPDKRPTTFGTSTPVPSSLLGQLMFPFRKR